LSDRCAVCWLAVLKQMPAICRVRDISAFRRGVFAVNRRGDDDQVAAADRGALSLGDRVPQLNTRRRRTPSVRLLLRTTVHQGTFWCDIGYAT